MVTVVICVRCIAIAVCFCSHYLCEDKVGQLTVLGEPQSLTALVNSPINKDRVKDLDGQKTKTGGHNVRRYL